MHKRKWIKSETNKQKQNKFLRTRKEEHRKKRKKKGVYGAGLLAVQDYSKSHQDVETSVHQTAVKRPLLLGRRAVWIKSQKKKKSYKVNSSLYDTTCYCWLLERLSDGERKVNIYIYIHAKSQAKTKCLLVITNTKFYSEKTMPDEQTEKRKRSRGFAVHLLARVEIFFFPMYKYCYIFFSSRKLKSKIALGDKRRKETNKKRKCRKKEWQEI